MLTPKLTTYDIIYHLTYSPLRDMQKPLSLTKRNVSPEEYEVARRKNPNALDYPKVKKQGIVLKLKNSNWVIVKNKYPYLEYDYRKVQACYMLIPKDNDIQHFKDLKQRDLSEIQKYIEIIRKKVNNKYVFQIMWKESHKSIAKFHIHLIICKI